ncbi:MAG TPA: hypothetical protein VGG61_14765 [Gemmataceae bacterium]|jgi:hypothetical protein
MCLAVALPTWDELRDYVQRILCGRDQIDPSQTALIEVPIHRLGRQCGVLFRARGPRLQQTHAIWAAEEDRLLFYDSRGVRFAETHLTERPDLCLAVSSGLAEN